MSLAGRDSFDGAKKIRRRGEFFSLRFGLISSRLGASLAGSKPALSVYHKTASMGINY